MQKISVLNKSRPQSKAITATYRPDFMGKFKGLMFKKDFTSEDSIVMDQKADSKLDSAIHMLFMSFQIAVIWVNSDIQIVDARLAKPWELACFPKLPARYVIETTTDYLKEYLPGDQLEFRYE